MNLRRHTHNPALFAVLVWVVSALLILPACSTKKNTAMSRNWHAFNTRYNVYFNGSEHYKEQIKNMEGAYEDDYTRRLLMHPAEARADTKLPQPQGDFKRTIEKMQKAIQLHSIKKKPRKKGSSEKEKKFRAREEFNPFLHNAWLMLGKAQFLNGDFLGAASTFFYISKHFKWLPDVVTEALLWQARSYCALSWNYEAENILTHIHDKQLTTSSLRDMYNNVMADFLVRSDRYKEAIPYLTKAAKKAKGTQRNRIYFLLGQVYSHEGNKTAAYSAFKKAGSGAGTSYRTKFNARIKQSEVYTGKNIRGEVNALRAMARYERNKEFLDQIYYAIGNLYLSRKDTAKAKENYHLAVEKSTRKGIDCALADLALGNIYFAEGDYVKAQPCYSASVSQLPDNYPDVKNLKRRSDVLDELATYAGNVQLQDSLLELSELSEEEQLKVCTRIAEELKKKEKEEAEAAKREEYLANQEAQGNQIKPGGSAAPTQYTMNNDKSWYFYNETAKNAGKTEFQRKWGARRLEDDWRRRNKNTFAIEEEDNEDENTQPADSIGADGKELTDEEKEAAQKENDPHYAEYYMKQIPRTDEEKRVCNDIIQEGLYNMGLILKDKLEDFAAARKEFLELDRRYPDNIYRLDVYYNMYLMAVRENDTAEAEKYRSLIISEFPESPYGQAMRDPNYFDRLREMNAVQESMYEEAYTAYLDDKNPEVHRLTEEMEKEYPLSKILPKFIFIDALSYMTEKDYSKFKERLTYLLDKWPDTDMTPMAGGILKGLQAGRKPNGGGSNSRGMIWDMRLSNDTVATAADGQPANFERDPDKPQYLVLAFPKDSVNSNRLLYDVARYNFSSFVVKDFDLEPMSFGNVGLLVIKGFANLKELERYRSRMDGPDGMSLPGGVRPIMISKANFELLLREGRSFEEYFRFEQEDAVEKKEEEILGPGMTMPSPDDPGDEADTESETQPEEKEVEENPQPLPEKEPESPETENVLME